MKSDKNFIHQREAINYPFPFIRDDLVESCGFVLGFNFFISFLMLM